MEAAAGVGDSAIVSLPGYDERMRDEVIASIPSCSVCGVKMGIFGNWRGKGRPFIVCKNKECNNKNVLRPNQY